jgi:hypothetical protein
MHCSFRGTKNVFLGKHKEMTTNHEEIYRGRHSKFQKLCPGPFKIAFVLGTNYYLLKDLEE